MTETAYQALRRERAAQPTAEKPPARRRFDPQTSKARSAERNRRNVEATRRAWNVLVSRHRDEFDSLLADERAGIDAERGPLPGDAELGS